MIIAGGLSSKIKGADGGIHLTKAKESLGLMEEINTRNAKKTFQYMALQRILIFYLPYYLLQYGGI